MSDLPRAKYKNGSSYDGNRQFLGNGLQRSCGRCGQFRQPSEMKTKPPFGMCCAPSCKQKEKV